MGMAATAWDVLAKAANLAQMSGLHAAMLVAVLTSLLRVYHSNKRECARLERRSRRLHELLRWPATDDVALLLLRSLTGDPFFGKALGDAARLVDSYKRSTLWRRVRMATQLRDMQDVIDSYCGLLLFVNAHLLLQQQATDHRHPIAPSSDTSTRVPEVNDDTLQSPSAQQVTSRPAAAETPGTQGANGIGQGGIDTDPAGCESNVHVLLPIVISHA